MTLIKKNYILGMFLLILFTAACALAGRVPMTLSEKDASKTIELNIGDNLVIALEGNITTGYTWEMESKDNAVLRQVGDPQVTPQSQALGAPGKIALKFEAVNSGQAALKLVYHRPWEKDVAPLQTFEVTVVVK